LFSASPIKDYLEYLQSSILEETAGEVATYIPELAKADPNWFGISLVTTDGHVYEIGDSRIPFTIQSISKPFVYGLALEDHGVDKVLERIGVEPSGEAFNSISLRGEGGQPFNPMINAGAIATTGQVKGDSEADCFQRIMQMFERYCGRELALEESVYKSESSTGHRNRAIAHMLKNFDILDEDPMSSLENYFRQCSISVNCRDLGVIAATLANGGVNPTTGVQAVDSKYVENILSVMNTCGMYDFAGEWIYRVGMPAKSGVAGGILAVLPGQLGVGIFSPPLDPRGNSVRGIRTCQQLSKDYNLHMLNVPSTVQSVIRTQYTLDQISSNRIRPVEEREFLQVAGKQVKIIELQGELQFSSVEIILRSINDSIAHFDFLILNLKRVLRSDQSASKLFYSLLLRLRGMNKKLIFTRAEAHEGLHNYIYENLGTAKPRELFFASHNSAMEFCENTLLVGQCGVFGGSNTTDARNNVLFKGLSDPEIDLVLPLMSRNQYEKNEAVVTAGDEAKEIFLLINGSVRVVVHSLDGSYQRLASFAAGVCFGELAVTGLHKRTADIHAECAIECLVLTTEALEQFTIQHPTIGTTILRNIIGENAARLQKANETIGALS
jgi:glutaminase